ncbi:DUF2848 domain-containing protein [Oceaniglobus indicus]|uniref:DUF2848 domain-containing protein n=1 Tax=Oceaniglobus indicus TaxID=2047749 RepID=UPI000C17CB01|nr:DUF2848 domain-containing protein [Oceaniglobus indicus]
MQFQTDTGPVDIEITDLIVAGWTGRDTAAVQHHIDELAAIGVAPPSQVPLFYRTSRGLLTTATEIDVLGPDTSGEAEPVLIRHRGTLWLGLGSDHTDRQLETHSVAASKQACPKPCARRLWSYDSVRDRLDDIAIRAWIEEDGQWVLYQQGTLAMIRPLADLLAQAPLDDGGAMLCGTFSAIGSVRAAARFKAEMKDPERDAAISFSYEARALPIVT